MYQALLATILLTVTAGSSAFANQSALPQSNVAGIPGTLYCNQFGIGGNDFLLPMRVEGNRVFWEGAWHRAKFSMANDRLGRPELRGKLIDVLLLDRDFVARRHCLTFKASLSN